MSAGNLRIVQAENSPGSGDCSGDSSTSNNFSNRQAAQDSDYSIDETPSQKVRALKDIYES